MMLTVHHAAEAREVAFHLIGVRAVLRVRLAVIDAADRPAIVQRIPMRGFVGIDLRHAGDDPLGDLDAFALVHGHEGQRAPAALTERHHDAALAGLVFGQATVNAILTLFAGRMWPP